MRMRGAWILLVLLALGAVAQETLRPRPAPHRRPHSKLISMEFVNPDLIYAIKVLAREMGHNVYIGSGVEGSITISLRSVPAMGALALILKQQETDFIYKLILVSGLARQGDTGWLLQHPRAGQFPAIAGMFRAVEAGAPGTELAMLIWLRLEEPGR